MSQQIVYKNNINIGNNYCAMYIFMYVLLVRNFKKQLVRVILNEFIFICLNTDFINML